MRAAIEVGRQRPADLEDAFDGVEALAALLVEPGRAERAGDLQREHLGEGDVGRADGPLGGALEVEDPRSSPPWTTGAATSLRTSGRAAR